MNTLVCPCVRCARLTERNLPYYFECEKCGFFLCQPCDDTTRLLMWEEVEGADCYMCEPCRIKYADKYKK